VVIDPQGHWRWKDEAEFAAGGGIDTHEHQAPRARLLSASGG
jgi:hypothetical protein